MSFLFGSNFKDIWTSTKQSYDEPSPLDKAEKEFWIKIAQAYKSDIKQQTDKVELELRELQKAKEELGKTLVETHTTPLSVLKKIMYYKMKLYFDNDFL